MASRDTTHRFLRSTGAATFSQAWRVGVTFATMLLLKRVIPAGDWGVWNWALPLFLVLGAIRDLGLAYHVVRVKPRPFGNLLAQELVWGGALVAFTFLFAPLLSSAYSESHASVVPVLRWLTLFLFFEGLSTVPRVYFESELAIGRAVVPELLRNLCMAAVSVGLALNGFGIWSLVIGQVAAAALYAALLWWRAWGEIPLLWRRGDTLALIRQSAPLAFIWFLIILVRHVDPFILGWRFRGEVVGNYVFAYENAFRVSEIIFPAVGRALYPALVAFGSEVRKLFETYAMATVFLLAIEVPTALFLVLNAEIVLLLLGGAQWKEAPGYLRILCLAPLADPIGRFGGEVLKAKNQDRVWILSLVVTLATYITGGILLTGLLGPSGMAWIKLLPLGGLIMAWSLYRIDRDGFLALLRRISFVYLVPLPLFAAAYLLAGDNLKLRLALSLVSLAASLLLSGRRFGPQFRAFFRGSSET